jgi:hypothetical protein
VLAGTNHERPVFREQALTPSHGMLNQRRGGQIPEDFGLGSDTLRIKPAVRNSFVHGQIFLSKHVKSGDGRCQACRRIRMQSKRL